MKLLLASLLTIFVFASGLYVGITWERSQHVPGLPPQVVEKEKEYPVKDLNREEAPPPQKMVKYQPPKQVDSVTVAVPRGMARVGLVSLTREGLLIVDRGRNWIRIPVVVDSGAVHTSEYRFSRPKSGWRIEAGPQVSFIPDKGAVVRPFIGTSIRINRAAIGARISGPIDGRFSTHVTLGIRLYGNE